VQFNFTFPSLELYIHRKHNWHVVQFSFLFFSFLFFSVALFFSVLLLGKYGAHSVLKKAKLV